MPIGARLPLRRPNKVGRGRISLAVHHVCHPKWIPGDPPIVITGGHSSGGKDDSKWENNPRKEYSRRYLLAKGCEQQAHRNRKTDDETFKGTTVGQDQQTYSHDVGVPPTRASEKAWESTEHQQPPKGRHGSTEI